MVNELISYINMCVLIHKMEKRKSGNIMSSKMGGSGID